MSTSGRVAKRPATAPTVSARSVAHPRRVATLAATANASRPWPMNTSARRRHLSIINFSYCCRMNRSGRYPSPATKEGIVGTARGRLAAGAVCDLVVVRVADADYRPLVVHVAPQDAAFEVGDALGPGDETAHLARTGRVPWL